MQLDQAGLGDDQQMLVQPEPIEVPEASGSPPPRDNSSSQTSPYLCTERNTQQLAPHKQWFTEIRDAVLRGPAAPLLVNHAWINSNERLLFLRDHNNEHVSPQMLSNAFFLKFFMPAQIWTVVRMRKVVLAKYH
jgi:hypothetical protein